MNDIPTAAYEGVDVLAQRECDSELDSDYGVEGSPILSPLQASPCVEHPPCDSWAYSPSIGFNSLHNLKTDKAEISATRYEFVGWF